jgi:putative nucleotide binding protein
MFKQQSKEEYAIVLDFLPNGHPMDSKPGFLKTPIAQAVGKSYFVLLELVPKRGNFLQMHEEVYIGEGKRDKIHHIYGKIDYNRLTQTAKEELNFVVEELVKKNESKFINFFNKANPINTRRHQLELLPGIGKKHMMEILDKREEKLIESFNDIKERVKLMPDPEKTIVKRIINELMNEDKYYIFTGQ